MIMIMIIKISVYYNQNNNEKFLFSFIKVPQGDQLNDIKKYPDD